MINRKPDTVGISRLREVFIFEVRKCEGCAAP